MTKSITVRGTTYPSHGAAAQALGVSRQTVSAASRAGTADTIGTGPLQPGCEPRYVKPTVIGDHTFPSRKAAAEALGVSLPQLSGHIAVLAALEKFNATPLCAAHNEELNRAAYRMICERRMTGRKQP
jgi:hypothetical protein